VLGQGDQVALAIGNLVANAVAYSPEGSTVTVAARPAAATAGGRPASGATGSGAPVADRSLVDIVVTDQGIGIPAGEIDRIFERFYRVDPARHRSTGGTGLGLSIVKHVAASHGGEVSVWSEPGQGSSFTLRLPGRPRSASGVPPVSAEADPSPSQQEAPR
jgi:two-component system sensor histidine kinase SenX3